MKQISSNIAAPFTWSTAVLFCTSQSPLLISKTTFEKIRVEPLGGGIY